MRAKLVVPASLLADAGLAAEHDAICPKKRFIDLHDTNQTFQNKAEIKNTKAANMGKNEEIFDHFTLAEESRLQKPKSHGGRPKHVTFVFHDVLENCVQNQMKNTCHDVNMVGLACYLSCRLTKKIFEN